MKDELAKNVTFLVIRMVEQTQFSSELSGNQVQRAVSS